MGFSSFSLKFFSNLGIPIFLWLVLNLLCQAIGCSNILPNLSQDGFTILLRCDLLLAIAKRESFSFKFISAANNSIFSSGILSIYSSNVLTLRSLLFCFNDSSCAWCMRFVSRLLALFGIKLDLFLIVSSNFSCCTLL